MTNHTNLFFFHLCKQCGSVDRYPSRLSGKTIYCKKCNNLVQLPSFDFSQYKLEFSCHYCDFTYLIKAEFVGRSGLCKSCGKEITIPHDFLESSRFIKSTSKISIQEEKAFLTLNRIDKIESAPGSAWKIDWMRYKGLLENYKVSCLYHFTDQFNLRSIRKNGLLSRNYCNCQNIKIINPGGNALSNRLDDKKGLGDYVHLSFNCKQPMMFVAQRDGRIEKTAIIQVNPDVIFWHDTHFSTENAASSNATIGNSFDVFEKIQFEIATRDNWTNFQEKAPFQAEVLVRTKIPSEFLLKIEDL